LAIPFAAALLVLSLSFIYCRGGGGVGHGSSGITPGDTDDDGDGVVNDDDACPNTPVGEVVDETGCSVSQLVPCDAPAEGGSWKNHGQYVATVADVSRGFRDGGLLTPEERAAIVGAAAQSACGKDEADPEPPPGPVPGPDDADGDGVADASDLCPGTTEIPVNTDGCSIADLVPCDGDWSNHGEYVAAVADVSRDFVDAGLISHDDRSFIVQSAAKSDCGR
jgi:hypothetical protein